MAQIDVSINGRGYRVACDDGQEDHLRQLAEYMDERVKELVASVGQAGEGRLLVMVGLLMADELAEAYARLEAQPTDDAESENGEAVENAEEILAAATESLAQRIENIAARMEGA